MRCPAINELPEPPAGKKGWPWTDTGTKVSATTLPEIAWPRVSVVTPSYNQGRFLEETIRSVLLQDYPDLEYIVMDGGSTDESIDIIRKYSNWLTHWVSAPDGGQAAAINQGWRLSTGEILTWLNSDDVLLPVSLRSTIRDLTSSPGIDLVYGDVLRIDENSAVYPSPYDRRRGGSFSRENLILHWRNPVPQPGFVMTRKCIERIGDLDESLHFALDFEYWIRLALSGCRGNRVNLPVAGFRIHEGAKGSRSQLVRLEERYQILKRS